MIIPSLFIFTNTFGQEVKPQGNYKLVELVLFFVLWFKTVPINPIIHS